MKRQEDPSKRETFWKVVCDMTMFLPLLLVSFSVIALLSLFALVYADPDAASYPIIKVNLGLNVGGFVLIAYILRRCGQRRRR